MNIYFPRHANPEDVAEVFNSEVKTYINLRKEYLHDCEDISGRIGAWLIYAREFHQYRIQLVKFLYEKGVRTAILGFDGKYKMVGSPYPRDSLFPF